MDDALFAVDPQPAAAPLSAGQRLTLRQAEAVRRGAHPLGRVDSSIRLHPGADPSRTASPDNAAARPLRCGTCRHRTPVHGGANAYPKCVLVSPAGRLTRVTHGPASDVRSWWPGCLDWQPRTEG